MSAMEQRLSGSIAEVADTLRGQDDRLRSVEISTAVNDAITRMAVDIATNSSANIAAGTPSDDDETRPSKDTPCTSKEEVYRGGLKVQGEEADKGRPFRQKTFRMGSPRIDIDKALALAAALEDEEVIRKMSLRK